MRSLTSQQLLAVWECGLNQAPVQRALTLLLTACPDLPEETIAGMSIGQRDARLMALRELTFGSVINSAIDCPKCNERLELNFPLHEVRSDAKIESANPLSLEFEGYSVIFRLPNSIDLMSLPQPANEKASQYQLLERCILSLERQRKKVLPESLPEQVQNAIITELSNADPEADIQLVVDCAACQHQWAVSFDIVSFFWAEINAWAQRLLREIHVLARAYSWRESDILAMSPLRRQWYLEMLGA